MRHRTADRQVEKLSRQERRRSDRSADDRRARAVNRRVHIVRAPRAEVRDRTAGRRAYDTLGFRRNQGLMIDYIQNCRFHQLGFHDRGHDLDKRLMRKNDRPLGNRINIA